MDNSTTLSEISIIQWCYLLGNRGISASSTDWKFIRLGKAKLDNFNAWGQYVLMDADALSSEFSPSVMIR